MKIIAGTIAALLSIAAIGIGIYIDVVNRQPDEAAIFLLLAILLRMDSNNMLRKD